MDKNIQTRNATSESVSLFGRNVGRLRRMAAITALTAAALTPMHGAEFFVAVSGDDGSEGTREKPFATVQRGLDTLKAGDILTIRPGEYAGSFRRDDLGDESAETVIRAEIPGTAVLHGDVPAPKFQPLAGVPRVYEAEFSGNVESVVEVDTLSLFKPAASAEDLSFLRGGFYHDQKNGKLYISTSDLRPADVHRYRISVNSKCGLFLAKPRRVIIDGLALTGYNSCMGRSLQAQTEQGVVWGIWLFQATQCVVKNCTAYLNGGGIGIQSTKTMGGNLVEDCTVYANESSFTNSSGGILVFGGNSDTVRDCFAFRFRPQNYAFRFYSGDGGVGPGPSLIESCIALSGGVAQKGDKLPELGTIKNTAALGDLHGNHVDHAIGGANRYVAKGAQVSNSISLIQRKDLDLNAEFADPLNGDFRLQETSQFRSRKEGTPDAGLLKGSGQVYYLKPGGDDNANGLSVKDAWKTLSRATQSLRQGDTLYLSGGRYDGDLTVSLGRSGGGTTAIRRRGHETVVIKGSVRIADTDALECDGLQFQGEVSASGGGNLAFNNCFFAGKKNGLSAKGVSGLRVTHNIFAGFHEAGLQLTDAEGVFLSGNYFANTNGPAVAANDLTTILYANYNGYANDSQARSGQTLPLGSLENRSNMLSAEIVEKDGVFEIGNAATLAALGPLGRGLGPNRFEDAPELRIQGPEVHSVSARTANIEWQINGPMLCRIGWGTTPDCPNTQVVEADDFGTFSLTGLKPGTTYYFRLNSLAPPPGLDLSSDDDGDDAGAESSASNDDTKATSLDSKPLAFTTLKEDAPPATYYVSPDGDNGKSGLDRENAWRSINHAASRVNVGDTVLITSGTYSDRIRARATGDVDAPITFRGLPGEKAFITGSKKQTSPAFLIANKKHLRVDGLYFKELNPTSGKWAPLQRATALMLATAEDVQITRCFYEGRNPGLYPTYSPYFLWADHVKNLVVKNCVAIRGFHHITIEDCEDVKIANNVLLQSMIVQIDFGGRLKDVRIENNIITDSLPVKFTASLMGRDNAEGVEFQNNDLFLRRRYVERNHVFFRKGSPLDPVSEADKVKLGEATRSLFVDPQFAVWSKLSEREKTAAEFPVDALIKQGTLPLDFADFFATNPEVRARNIGLEPEAWKDPEGKRDEVAASPQP